LIQFGGRVYGKNYKNRILKAKYLQLYKICIRISNPALNSEKIALIFLTVILGYGKGKIFLNDLEEYFIENNIDSLEKISSICQESLLVYIKLFLILYADDTVLMSETPQGLQKTLTAFENYCNNWKLKVNTSKTKVVVFSKRRFRSNFIF
jgi:hypothetical protein